MPANYRSQEISKDAADKAAFIEELMHDSEMGHPEDTLDLNDTIYSLLDAVGRGISVLEINWKVRNGLYIPISTNKVPASCLGFETKGASTESDANPEELMLFPDRNKVNPEKFTKYPCKFLIGIYRGKSGHIAETAQLRALAHHWVGRMLGWEWMAQKTELFGIPIRWATYNTGATDAEINEIKNMLENMGTAAWGAFPNGTDLDVIQGSTPGVAGSGEPTERIQAIADRACDLIFLGQNLTSESGSSGSYALGSIHRQVELDLYEAYANYVEDVINHQLIPAILQLNYGNSTNSPHVRLLQDNSEIDRTLVDRDKILFNEMKLPVSKTWLYNRHSVPEPSRDDILYDPEGEPIELINGLSQKDPMQATQEACCSHTVHARGETTAEYEARASAGQIDLNELLGATNMDTHDLAWDAGGHSDCDICAGLDGRTYPDAWTTPPPIHHNCDCVIKVIRKT
jgi:phage gp29-like protein